MDWLTPSQIAPAQAWNPGTTKKEMKIAANELSITPRIPQTDVEPDRIKSLSMEIVDSFLEAAEETKVRESFLEPGAWRGRREKAPPAGLAGPSRELLLCPTTADQEGGADEAKKRCRRLRNCAMGCDLLIAPVEGESLGSGWICLNAHIIQGDRS